MVKYLLLTAYQTGEVYKGRANKLAGSTICAISDNVDSTPNCWR